MPLSVAERTDLLRRVSLFEEIDDDALRAIAELVTEVEVPAGRYLARQGEIGSGLYLVASGRVRIVRGESVLAHLGPGEFFGELSVIDQRPRLANAVAEEPTLCLALASWDLLPLLEREPGIALAMLRTLAMRLRSVTEHHAQ